MKEILKLTKNEFVKQLKKKSILITVIALMSLSILVPVISKVVESGEGKGEVIYSNEENLIKSGTSNKIKIENSMNKSYDEYINLQKESKFVFNDWRTDLAREYQESYSTLLLLENIKDGVPVSEIIEYGYNFNREEIEKTQGMSKEELNKEIEKCEKKTERIKEIIVKEDYVKYLSDRIEMLKKGQIELKKQEEAVKKQGNVEEIKDIQRGIRENENELKIAEYRIENKVSFDKNDWRNKTLLNIEELNYKVSMEKLTEKQFLQESNYKVPYNEYIQIFDKEREKEKEQIEKNWYSLKNNIPQMEFSKDARNILVNSYDIFVILAVIIVIIVGGGIVSNEFSSGTIRLLLIRPIKRWKVLTSKLLMLFIMAIGILLISEFILIITTGLLYGFKGYGIGVIDVVQGKIIESNFWIYMMKNLLISSAGIVFMIGLVFFITTVIKNTAVAVGVSLIVYLGAAPLTLAIGLLSGMVVNTPIPYINQSLINLMPMFTNPLKEFKGLVFNEGIGAIIIIIIGILLIGISYIKFSKEDVKN